MRKFSVYLAVLLGILLLTSLSMAQMRVEDADEDEEIDSEVLTLEEEALDEEAEFDMLPTAPETRSDDKTSTDDKARETPPLWIYSATSAPVTLSNGSGDGAVQITVDGYGSFGSSTPAGDAFYDPIGPLGSAGTVYESGIFFGPIQNFLTTDSFGAALPPIDFTNTIGTEVRSKFSSANYNFQLTQYVTPKRDKGSTFVQQYRITNKTGSNQTLTMGRHVDGDLKFYGDYRNDRGGILGGGKWLMEYDTKDNGQIDPVTKLSLYAANSHSKTVQPYRFTDDIISSNGIPDWANGQIFGDDNGNGLSDYGFDVTLSQQREFSIKKNQTLIVITKTYFGNGGVEIQYPVAMSGSEYPVANGAGDWGFDAGSQWHRVGGGIKGADDTFAVDTNLPSDADDGIPVHPVARGVVVQSIRANGWVLVQHSVPLRLVNGEKLETWYSGYLHMTNIIENGQEVSTATTLGNISMVKADNNHLHFAIYRGPENLPPNDNSGLVSIDFVHQIPSIGGQIDRWIEWCGTNPVSKPGPWWESGETPCDYQ